MLEKACMTPENNFTYTICIDNDFIYRKWGELDIFSSLREACKI